MRRIAARWPALWEGPKCIGEEEAREEKERADTTFLGGEHQKYVGKLGTLLGGCEERHSERHRQGKRSTSRPGTQESAQALQHSRSYAKLENYSFMDILRYSLNASTHSHSTVC
jgi:hypothetical protein